MAQTNGHVQPLSSADVTAIQSVIQDQLDAIYSGDASRAFAHASPAIQAKFGTATQFLNMVHEHYPAVAFPQVVRFGTLLQREEPSQLVHLVDPQGRAIAALYQMERQEDQSWRIKGCILLRDHSETD